MQIWKETLEQRFMWLFIVFSVEPFPRVLPDRAEGQVMAQLVQDAGACREEGVRLFPTDIRASVWYEVIKARMGRWRQQAEVDHKTGITLSHD